MTTADREKLDSNCKRNLNTWGRPSAVRLEVFNSWNEALRLDQTSYAGIILEVDVEWGRCCRQDVTTGDDFVPCSPGVHLAIPGDFLVGTTKGVGW